MPKNKRPVPRTSNNSRDSDNDAQARVLSDLALELAEGEERLGIDMEALERLEALVRKALKRGRDTMLYEAIELARYTDPLACRLLRGAVEE